MRPLRQNKKMQIRIDEDKRKAFNLYCITRGTNMSRTIIKYINELLTADNNELNLN